MNNNKKKYYNNIVDNTNEKILSNQNIKIKSNNSFWPVSNKRIKISTKGKHKILNDNDNDNESIGKSDPLFVSDQESAEIDESSLFSDIKTTKKINVKINEKHW